MDFYPRVSGEQATLRSVLAGASLARYGDGEFNLCTGRGIPCQMFEAELAARLRALLLAPPAGCLVGIPNLQDLMDRGPAAKRIFWRPYLTSTLRFLGDVTYASAFVSRPDSAPWIDTTEYWSALEGLWAGQDVTLVYGGGRSLTPEDLTGARRVVGVQCPRMDAWRSHEDILRRIGYPARVLLCLGPTATVLAADLCDRGVQAVDLGHAGLWLRKHRTGVPMVRTAEDSRL